MSPLNPLRTLAGCLLTFVLVGCASSGPTIPPSFGPDCHRRYMAPSAGDLRDVTLTVTDGLQPEYELRLVCITLDHDGTVLQTDQQELKRAHPALRMLHVTSGRHALVFRGLWRHGGQGFEIKTTRIFEVPSTRRLDVESYARPAERVQDRPRVRWRETTVGAATVVLRAVDFMRQSDELSADSVITARRNAETLVAHPELTSIRVEGHSDPNESDGIALGRRRAESVVRVLVDAGVEPNRLSAAVADAACDPKARVTFEIAATSSGPVEATRCKGH